MHFVWVRNLLLILLSLMAISADASPVVWGSPYPTVLGKGGIRFKASDTSTTCNAGATGSIRYNAGTFEGCNGSAWSALGGAVSLSALTAAAANNSIDNTTRLQTWTWSTLGSGSAMKFATSSTSFTGNSVEITNASTNAGVGMKIDMTGTSGNQTGLIMDVDSNGTSARGIQVNMTGVNHLNPGLEINDASTDGSTGIWVNQSATTGANVGILVSSPSTNASAISGNFTLSSATAQGNTVIATHSGTAGFALDANATAVGTRDVVRVRNTRAAANDNAARIVFANNRTGTTNTLVAGVAGMITDITSNAYKGALVFSTANNAAPAEKVRINETGQFVFSNNDGDFVSPDSSSKTKGFSFTTGDTTFVSSTVDEIITGSFRVTTGSSSGDQQETDLPTTGVVHLTTGDGTGDFTPSGAVVVSTGSSAWNSGNISFNTGPGAEGSSDGYSGHIISTTGVPTGTGKRGYVKVDALGLMITTTDAEPTCSADYRGVIRVVQGGAGVADLVKVCLKNSSDNYAWVTVTTS